MQAGGGGGGIGGNASGREGEGRRRGQVEEGEDGGGHQFLGAAKRLRRHVACPGTSPYPITYTLYPTLYTLYPLYPARHRSIHVARTHDQARAPYSQGPTM